MTPDSSRFDLTPLREAVAVWWQSEVGDLAPEAAEQLALTLSRALAQTMLQTALASSSGKRSYRGAAVPCRTCGGKARFVGYRTRWLRTLCGEQRVERAYYHCAACREGQLPWDEAAGLNARIFTPSVKALVAECCARLTHREVEDLLARVLGLELEESSQQEVVGEVGARLRAAEATQIEACFGRLAVVPPECPAPGCERGAVSAPPRLYVGIDAAKAHTGGSWHDMKCAVLYPGQPGPPGQPGSPGERAGAKRYVARQEEAGAFGQRVYVEALKAGLAITPEVVVLGDGADWIWKLADEHFHGATEILDYYHAAEHLWKLAAVLYGQESPQGRRWAAERCHDLKVNGPRGLLRALARRKAKGTLAQEELRLARGYFRTHRRRMDYPGFRKRGLMIGSGPVEAACKVVVGQRLKGAGMRWSEAGADAMLAVRTTVLNGLHERLAQYSRAA